MKITESVRELLWLNAYLAENPDIKVTIFYDGLYCVETTIKGNRYSSYAEDLPQALKLFKTHIEYIPE